MHSPRFAPITLEDNINYTQIKRFTPLIQITKNIKNKTMMIDINAILFVTILASPCEGAAIIIQMRKYHKTTSNFKKKIS
jgi:hypothetical protein